MALLLRLLGVDALLGGTFAVLHRLEHLLGVLLAHAALLLLLLLLLVLFILILVLVLFVLILLILVLLVLILVLVLVLVFVLILVLILVLVFVLILVFILVLVFVLILLLFFELGEAQVVTRLVVVGVTAQGVLVELYRLAVVLAAVGDVAQVITGLAAQSLVLCAFCQIGEDTLGLLHRILVVLLL